MKRFELRGVVKYMTACHLNMIRQNWSYTKLRRNTNKLSGISTNRQYVTSVFPQVLYNRKLKNLYPEEHLKVI